MHGRILEFFGNLGELLGILTLPRVLLFGLLIAMSVGGWVVFENRQTIYANTISRLDSPGMRKPFSLSLESKGTLDNFVKSRKHVELVQVIDMDLYKNSRQVLYTVASSLKAREIIAHAGWGSSSNYLPLFSSDERQNAQMIALINNEFRCGPAEHGGLTTLLPEITELVTTSCRVPIPPNGLGRIYGYIAIHLNKEPTQYEMDQLRLAAFQMSMRIYFVDIMKDPTAYDGK